ncbi:MAG: Corrinoid/iron-sulfur protein large subunit [Syntrophorhabdaceae bacterium PtaU1.Bin034]|jgi:acetyl-CoA decarbonylase/synthase complex subunit gamma|nr:MAG: Corrinoid/iron-sulfur protein large subunit [Syntrophorhabdaceae bacterium PtaU1.Bin034]
MNYRVDPGLYAIGKPTEESPVFVTANYKLSFDLLRRAISSIHGWILILDTLGINVWCAAGKGTFGTDELVDRIQSSGLADVVSHRRLIVPQLGAPGIAAHEVKRRSGFQVIYGPVRAEDLPAFLKQGLKAEGRMRTKDFGFMERLALVPMEVLPAVKTALPAVAGLFVLSFLMTGLSAPRALGSVLVPLVVIGASILAGAVLTPLFLPWLPGRAFSIKGFIVGLLSAVVISLIIGSGHNPSVAGTLVPLISIPAMSAYLAMNFTGSSTFTSLSGVRKEMRFALPLEITGVAAGLVLWIIAIAGG